MSERYGAFAPLEVTGDVLDALASGGGGPRTWALLRAARRSRNLLLLRGLYERARAAARDGEGAGRSGAGTGLAGRGGAGPGGAGGGAAPGAASSGAAGAFLEAGMTLLRTVQAQAPAVFTDVMDDPMTGAWLGCWARDAPLSEPAAHTAALAAAAALRARVPFRITVPVRAGAVVLPALGLAAVPGAQDTVAVAFGSGGGEGGVAGPAAAVRVPAGRGPGGGGWHPLPRLTFTAGSLSWTPQLDSLNPFRVGHRPVAPRPLEAAEAAEWESELRAAWELLARRHPERAGEIAGLQSSVVPLGGEEPAVDGRGGWLSATLGDAVGHIALAPHPGTRALAAGLVHETQHSKLCALLDLVELVDAPPDTRCYSPWREDPRPVSGLLHGAYAFLAVTEFWRGERGERGKHEDRGEGGGRGEAAAGSPASGRGGEAAARFALRHEQVRGALDALAASAWLTADGRRFVAAMRRTLDSSADAAPSARERRRALAGAAEHRVRWRLRHLPPPAPAAVRLLAAAHARGTPAPDAAALPPGPLPGRAEPPDRWVLPAAPPPPHAARTAADLEDRLSWPGAGTPEQWARLAAAALLLGDARAPALAAAPELVRAVHAALRGPGGDASAPVRCSPLDLAWWLLPAMTDRPVSPGA